MVYAYSSHTKHSVLVVDDDPAIVRMLSVVLHKDGFNVLEATSAQMALDLVKSQLPCMVLADVMMPGMDGFEFCRMIKADPSTGHIPVALVTAMTRAEHVAQGVAAGAADYIKKPFDFAELRMRVHTQILLHEALLEWQRAHRHLRAISTASNDAIIVMDNDGAISHWNEAAERIFGYSRAEAVGRDLHSLVVPIAHRDRCAATLARFRDSGEGPPVGKTVELQALHKSGVEFPIEVSLSATRIDDRWCAVGIIRDLTRQKALQATATKHQTQYRLLFETSHDAMSTFSPVTGHYVSCNQALIRLFGLPDDVRIEDFSPALLSPERQPNGQLSSDLIPVVFDIANREGSAVFNWMHQRLNGEQFYCDVRLTRVGADADLVVMATVRDITESSRQAELLQQSESRYRTSFEAAPVGQALTDSTGMILEANAALATMLGYGPHELAGKVLFNFTHPDDRAACKPMFPDPNDGADVRRCEKRYVGKRGDIVWVDISVAAMRDAAGGPPRFLAHVINITERKRAEQAVAAGNDFRDTLLNAIPVPVFFRDAEGRYSAVNRALNEFLGAPESEISQMPAFAIYPSHTNQAERLRALDLLSSQVATISDVKLANSLGESRQVVFHKAAVSDKCGNPAGMIGVIIDITERRRVENELQHARKLEAVGQLAAGIAHEINTPAQYVGDGIYFLKEAFDVCWQLIEKQKAALQKACGGEDVTQILEQLRSFEEDNDLDYVRTHVPGSLERCLDGISRISSIVRAMKEFSHPDQREKVPADINQAIRSTTTISRNEYKYVADLELDLHELPPVPCHIGDLNQVFLNLIVNSAHAIAGVVGSTGAKGTIRVSTCQENDYARIDIADTGTGIPESVQGHIFEPFFTTKEVGKGSGQGLAIARSIIVDKHCGTLTFQSREGVGTTFTIRLPLQETSPQSRSSPRGGASIKD